MGDKARKINRDTQPICARSELLGDAAGRIYSGDEDEKISNWYISVFFTFGPSGAISAGDTDIRSSIETLNATWNEAFNSGDASAVAALYAENATLSPGNGKLLRGQAEIENLFQSFIDNGVTNHRIEIVDVRAENDFAYEVARWSANGPGKGAKATNLGGVLMHVFKRGKDGEWKSVANVWNVLTE